jgi:hypothetical protein
MSTHLDTMVIDWHPASDKKNGIRLSSEPKA